MTDRPYGSRYPFSRDISGVNQSNSNSQGIDRPFMTPAQKLVPDPSYRPSVGLTPQHHTYSSATTLLNQQKAHDLERDELLARFLGWEVTLHVRENLSDQKKRKVFLSNNWFNMCEGLERDYASKSEVCRRNNYDKVWCPMKLENYYNFIKQETKTHYPEEFAKISWDKKMDPHIKTVMLSQVAHKGASLLGCIAILKSSLGPPAPNPRQQNNPQMNTPSYASPVQHSIWGPPDSTPYTQYPINSDPRQKKWPK